ncbi:MAG TPA: hypothetical protein VMB79_15705 [Jatrophihabitans sp.]|nr:hypothetical protein [Jatrophihabitans sp.]
MITADPLSARKSDLTGAAGWVLWTADPEPPASMAAGRQVDGWLSQDHYTARYADGAPLAPTARTGFCGDLGIGNDARAGQAIDPLLSLLRRTVGSLGAWPGRVVPLR